MPGQCPCKSLLLFVALLLPLTFTSSEAQTNTCNSNDPSAPCFAGVKDILNGQRVLLQDYDLVLAGNFGSGSPFTTASAVLTTSKSQLTPSSMFDGVYDSQRGRVISNTIANTARLFDSKSAVSIGAFAVYGSGSSAVSVFFGRISNGQVVFPPAADTILASNGSQFNSNQNLYSVAADFAGTGRDQLVIADWQPAISSLSFQAVASSSPSSPYPLAVNGPVSTFSYSSSLYALATGTFTDPPATGAAPAPQIAVLSSPGGLGLQLALFSVDPASLQVSSSGKPLTLNLGNDSNAQMATISMAAGRFGGAQHDQLVIAYAPYGGETAKIVTVDFNSGAPVQLTTPYDTGVSFIAQSPQGYGYPGSVILQKGRFNFFGDTDQAALSLVPGQKSVILEVLSFDQQLNVTEGPRYTPPNACHYAMTVGRFDRYSRSSPSTISPYPEIADTSTNCTSSVPVTVSIYDVDPSSFTINIRNSYNVPRSYVPAGPYYGTYLPTDNALQLSLAAGDLQGRSLLLGDPEKAVVTGHIQPDVVLGLPPMHVDWITPAEGTVPSVVNVSVYPKTYNTAYNFQSSAESSSSRSQTTSYTAATKETASESVSYGIPGIASVSVDAKQALTQTHEGSVAKKYNTYQGIQTQINTATVFDDELTATANRMNIYSYRVIGQCAASSGAPGQEGCAPGYAPVYVQFSGPDNVQYLQFAEGANLEWYQPVQEAGNLLSYPGSLDQLEANLPPSTPLVPYTNLINFDVQGNGTELLNWSVGNGSSVTSSSVSSHSFDASVSVSGSAALDFFSGEASAGFDYNSSNSISTMNQSTSSLDSSQGIATSFGVEAPESAYDYFVTPVIYGQQPRSGTLQSDIVQTTQVKATGVLDVAWIADPYSGGNFWRQAYGSYPDVALNHPQRWLQKTPSGVHSQEVRFQCPVGYESSYSSPGCTEQSPLPLVTPSNVALDDFYLIKGLFVTPGLSTNGPQVTNAKVGDTVTLRVRVYNYSLQSASALPPGTKVRVQFYAQPWNGVRGEFLSKPNTDAFADAVFIGEDLLAPIPGICGGSTSPNDPCTSVGTSSISNWKFAKTTWNTSSLQSNSYWKFWVIVWLENNGKMLPEIAGHGLPASTLAACLGKPGVPCFQNLGDVSVASLHDMEFDPYTNNFGFYNQVFSLFLATGATESPSGSLILESVKSTGGNVLLRDQPARIEAHHQAIGRRYNNVLAVYYDGDPDKGGKQYDVEYIPGITADSTYVDPGNYVPRSCGTHELFVRSIATDGSAPVATASTKVKVTIDAVQSINETLSYIGGLKIDSCLKEELKKKLDEARRAFEKSNPAEGRCKTEEFLEIVRHHEKEIPAKAVDAIIDQEKDLLDCIG